MKIWCTFYSAGSLLSAGLERVQVWFAKPEWVVESRIMWYDSPFGDPDLDPKKGVLKRHGWFREYSVGEKFEREYLSFGKVFGYGDDDDPQKAVLAKHVWGKIGEFYGTDNLYVWDDIERKGLNTVPHTHQPYQFLLEIDLDIILKT